MEPLRGVIRKTHEIDVRAGGRWRFEAREHERSTHGDAPCTELGFPLMVGAMKRLLRGYREHAEADLPSADTRLSQAPSCSTRAPPFEAPARAGVAAAPRPIIAKAEPREAPASLIPVLAPQPLSTAESTTVTMAFGALHYTV